LPEKRSPGVASSTDETDPFAAHRQRKLPDAREIGFDDTGNADPNLEPGRAPAD
jgi:hypothetical protein